MTQNDDDSDVYSVFGGSKGNTLYSLILQTAASEHGDRGGHCAWEVWELQILPASLLLCSGEHYLAHSGLGEHILLVHYQVTCKNILLRRREADWQRHPPTRSVLLLATSLAGLLPLLSRQHSPLSTSFHGSSYESDRLGHRDMTVA